MSKIHCTFPDYIGYNVNNFYKSIYKMKSVLITITLAMCVIITHGKGLSGIKENNSGNSLAEFGTSKSLPSIQQHGILSFIENKGQVTDQNNASRADIDFKVAAASGLNIFIGSGAIHYQFCKSDNQGNAFGKFSSLNDANHSVSNTMYRMDVELIDANTRANVLVEGQNDYFENYITSATNGELTRVNSFSRITYKNIYPNIDWVLYINDGKLEHEFVVREGGKVSDIKLKYGGATDLQVNKLGCLVATTPLGTITENAPISYQKNGVRVTTAFKLTDDVLSYQAGNYSGELVIDPLIGWATYIGGTPTPTGNTICYAVATDSTGNVFTTGYTLSTNVNTTGAYQTTLPGTTDAFLAKFNSAGTQQWATYYGGTGATQAQGVATDHYGNVYITGFTASTSSITAGGTIHQATNAGGSSDAFLAKFNGNGTIKWATFYGGAGNDQAYAVTTDPTGNVYLGGTTSSASGIASVGAHLATLAGGNDAFLAKFDSTGVWQWGTYYGGNSTDEGLGLATDGVGNIYMTGVTVSPAGIATGGSYQSVLGGGTTSYDAFLVKFNAGGVGQWGTYYGSAGDEYGQGVATDASGNVYITGYTSGTLSPSSLTGAFQGTFGGGTNDAFLAGFNSTGTSLLFGTYYGGTGDDRGLGIAISGTNVYITGQTASTTGISTTGSYQASTGGGTDAFITQFNTSGSRLYASYYGGSGTDNGYGVATDTMRNIYFAGATSSTSGISYGAAHISTLTPGFTDGFLTRFSFALTSVSSNTLSVCAGGSATFTATGNATYTWSPAAGLSSVSGATVVATPTVTTTYTVTGLAGFATITLTVNPVPNVTAISSQTVCNTALTTSITFTGSVSPTTYSWTSSPLIGLATSSSSTGIFPSFTATNSGTVATVGVITVTPSTATCNGAAKTFSITVNPTPTLTISATASQTVCNNRPTTLVTFTSSVGGSSYTWTNSNTAIGLVATGSGASIGSFSATNTGVTAIEGTIDVTPSAAGCPGATKTFSITVNPTPTLTAIASQTVCNTQPTTLVTFASSVGGSNYTWTNSNTAIGLAATGSGVSIGSFSATNTSTTVINGIINVTPAVGGCSGSASSFTITVDPTPTLTAIASQTVCNNRPTTLVTFTSSVGGSSYTWTNSNTAIGLTATGSGVSIGSFSATNTGVTAIEGTIDVTPSAAGCPGATKTFSITVNPTPTLTAIASQTVCNTQPTTLVTFASSVGGSNYTWTNSNTAIGLAATGSGVSIGSFSATNTSTTVINGIINVTPAVGGCSGSAGSFTITVDPTPTLTAISSQTVCNTMMTSSITFTSSLLSSTYTWTNSNTAIGIAGSGSSSTINAFTATNTGTVVIVGVFSVIPTALGCSGAARTFTITVKPTPVIAPVASQTVCSGARISAITFTSDIPTATYAWVNNNTTIGLSAGATGNIAATIVSDTSHIVVDTAKIIVTPSVAGCTGLPDSFYIYVDPIPVLTGLTNDTFCNQTTTTAINFISSVSGSSFNWVNSDSAIGVGSRTGTGNIPIFIATNGTPSAVHSIFSVTPSANGCNGTVKTFTITVEPSPTVNPVSNRSTCNHVRVTATTFGSNVSGSTFAWTNSDTLIGLGASGNGSTPVFTAVNTSTVVYTAVISITGTSSLGCVGSPSTYTITVFPTPSVTRVANQTVCNGLNTRTVILGGTPSGVSLPWSNSNPGIGLAASGTASIAPFRAVDTTTNIDTASIIVLPFANGCSGKPDTFLFIVFPTPIDTGLSDQKLCNGTTSNPITFSGPVVGTTFNWANNNTAVGLPATGSGNIPSFSVTNTGTTIDTATITIISAANGCSNSSQKFHVIVYPTPKVVQPANQTICNGAKTDTVFFSSNVDSTSFVWAINDTTIGLRTHTGIRYFPSFTATDTSVTKDSMIVTVIPTAYGCQGATDSFKITVNPTAILTSALKDTICSGTVFSYTPNSATPGVSYAWTRPIVPHINPSSSSGTNSISEVLSVDTIAIFHATYVYSLSIGGCAHTQSLVVSVAPAPSKIPITVHPAANLCSNTLYQNFGASIPPALGVTYFWTAQNAVIYATGTTRQYALVSFPTPDTSYVILNANVTGGKCYSRDTFIVHVGSSVSEVPLISYSAGDYICLEDNADSFQWGYDNNQVLDSSKYVGQTNQNLSGSFFDIYTTNLWVLTWKGGCMEKTYFNVPNLVGTIPVNNSDDMTIFPDPASNEVSVLVSSAHSSYSDLKVFDIMGKIVISQPITDNKANVNVSGLPSGIYIVRCYQDGVKSLTSRFIKK